jgi:hypothetical protein
MGLMGQGVSKMNATTKRLLLPSSLAFLFWARAFLLLTLNYHLHARVYFGFKAHVEPNAEEGQDL